MILFTCAENVKWAQLAATVFNTLADVSVARAVCSGAPARRHSDTSVVRALRGLAVDPAMNRPMPLTRKLAHSVHRLILIGAPEQILVEGRFPDYHWPGPAPAETSRDAAGWIEEYVRKLIQREEVGPRKRPPGSM